jgi:LruC domain-containing protein
MKKQVTLLSLVLLVISLFSGCRKDHEQIQKKAEKTSELLVPTDFKWKTTLDVGLKVSLPMNGFFPLTSKISVYQGNPFSGGLLIASGSVSKESAFEQIVRIPAYLNSLYLYLETTAGTQQIVEVPVLGNQLSYTFESSDVKQFFKSLNAVQEVGPECNDCDQVISGSGNYNIGNGKTYCVQDNFTGTITFQTWNGGGTLKICGTATINQNISLGTNSWIIVTQGGSLNINGIQMWGSGNGVKVYTNSSLQISGGLSTIGTFVNHGTMTIGGFTTFQLLSTPFVNTGVLSVGSGVNLNNATLLNSGTFSAAGVLKLNTGSSITNDGTITAGDQSELNGSTMVNNGSFSVSNSSFSINGGSSLTNNGNFNLTNGSFNVNSSGSTVNNGSISVSNQIKFNSGSNVTNNCKMTCGGLAEFNSGNIVFQNGYFRSNDRIQINGGANTILKDGSMLSAPRYFLYTNISGQGSTNTIKAETEFTMSSQTVSGPIELSTNNLNILSGTPVSQHFINGATVVAIGAEQNFLAITACNPEGLGSISVTDMDGDGVPDELDAFPNDPDRAFRSWYPNENNFSTIAFEDLWPGMGDFDFNDMVVIMQYEIVTNADNELVDLNGKFRLMAAGASLNNGFAVAIDVAPDHVASVSGGSIAGSLINFDAKGFEAGHTNQTVWIVMDAINDLYPGPDFLNTVPELAYVETDTITVSMTLSTPQANFGIAPFNPFIFVNQERGKEIHLLDFPPTALVDPVYFGMWEDNSTPQTGKYYKTDSNLPWAIEIPVNFDYPIEKVDILQTHLKFAEWATSGGTLFPDWYLNLTGYRNQGNVYVKP